jgi:serine/threonine-protein kinase
MYYILNTGLAGGFRPAPASQMAASSQIGQIGKYRVLRELGRGGMGVVYEAENSEVRHRVAIKMLNAEYAYEPQIMARFRAEGIAANLPQHAGIIHVLERGVHKDDGAPYIVMEYVEGESLRARLKHHPHGLPVKTVVRFGKQLADALAAAHERKIIHRDIKPENVMITRDSAVPGGERTKILDFGIAVVAKEYLSLSRDTQVNTNPFGTIIGTIAYMSPEQWQGARRDKIDDKADVYAMGAMLYELLTGQPPFVAEEAISVGYMHINKEPAPLKAENPRVPLLLADLVARMLAKAPRQRPAMEQVGKLLAHIDAAGVSSAQLDQLPRRGRRWVLVGGGALVVAAAAAVAIDAAPEVGLRLAPARVRWRIRSEPAGAQIIGPDERVLGVTPWVHDRPRDVGQLTVTLRLPGYRPVTLQLDHNRSTEQMISLQKAP